MTKMVLMAINSKTFKNLLLQNQKAYDFETWPNALERERGALQNLHDPGITSTYFTTKPIHIGRPCI